eukprot:TRINITY_DN31538_c0_g1_i1.p2 TRINITY_DN31538_c0_g1~~TRINITY_DN31538_c0_g1_i1.p2  ORF type:complete len:104 (+),score=7.61 TRINITY_DN31538_c0_g1_i1:265-576(+)
MGPGKAERWCMQAAESLQPSALQCIPVYPGIVAATGRTANSTMRRLVTTLCAASNGHLANHDSSAHHLSVGAAQCCRHSARTNERLPGFRHRRCRPSALTGCL